MRLFTVSLGNHSAVAVLVHPQYLVLLWIDRLRQSFQVRLQEVVAPVLSYPRFVRLVLQVTNLVLAVP